MSLLKRNVTVRKGQQLIMTLEQFPDILITSKGELESLLAQGWRVRELSGISPLYRSEWGAWHATREFIQNALDAGDGTYEFTHVDGFPPGVVISDNGKGITLEHLVLGQFKEDVLNLAARGRFGEGLKLACVTFLRQGKRVEINTVNYDFVPTFYVKLVDDPAEDEQFEELTFGFLYKQNNRVRGTDVTVYGQETSYSDLILFNHRESVIASFNVREPKNRALNVGAVTQAELITPYYRKSHDSNKPCLYVKDIWIQDLDPNNYTYSYNFAFVISPKAGSGLEPEVQPNRDAVNQTAINFAIDRLWALLIMSGDHQALVIDFLQATVNESRSHRSKLAIKESIDPYEWKLWSHPRGEDFESKRQVAENIASALKSVTYKHPESGVATPFPELNRIAFITGGPMVRRARAMGYVPIDDLVSYRGSQILEETMNILDIDILKEEELISLLEVRGVQTIPEYKLTAKQVKVMHTIKIIISRLYANRGYLYQVLNVEDSKKDLPQIQLSDGLTDIKTEVATLGKYIISQNKIVIDWSNNLDADPNHFTRLMFATLIHEFSHWVRNSNDGSELFRQDLETVWHLSSQLYGADRVYKKAVDTLLVKGTLKDILVLE